MPSSLVVHSRYYLPPSSVANPGIILGLSQPFFKGRRKKKYVLNEYTFLCYLHFWTEGNVAPLFRMLAKGNLQINTGIRKNKYCTAFIKSTETVSLTVLPYPASAQIAFNKQ